MALKKLDLEALKNMVKNEPSNSDLLPKMVEKVFHCPVHGDVIDYVQEHEEPSHCHLCEDAKRKTQRALDDLMQNELARYRQFREFFGEYLPFSLVDHKQTFENFVLSDQGTTEKTKAQALALKTAQRFAMRFTDRMLEGHEKSQRGMIFHGLYGTGKTHLASAIVQEVKKQGWHPLFWSIGDFFSLFKSGASLAHLPLKHHLARVQLLVLDEVGRSTGSEFENNLLMGLLDMRSKLGNPTVFLTNLEGKQYKEMLGGAIASRSSAYFWSVAFSWNDFRKNQATKQTTYEEIF